MAITRNDESNEFIWRESSSLSQQKSKVSQAQETIYGLLSTSVRTKPAATVLSDFQHLFLLYPEPNSEFICPALYTLLDKGSEEDFRYTLKRACYILINNWSSRREHERIQDLVQLFLQPLLIQPLAIASLIRLRVWLRNFVDSQDFQEVKLFTEKYEQPDPKAIDWKQRFASFLLAVQYLDTNNPQEQRTAAKQLAYQLKEKFQFDLAIYLARSQAKHREEHRSPNPTSLGENAVNLVKLILWKQKFYSYKHVSQLFVQQVKALSYREFKEALFRYLLYTLEDSVASSLLETQLLPGLQALHSDLDESTTNSFLWTRTCNWIIDALTIQEELQSPSTLFVAFLAQEDTLSLSLILLKVVLVCSHSQAYLDACIAKLIHFYEGRFGNDCTWIIQFLEVLRIALALHSEKTDFRLVASHTGARSRSSYHLDDYRVFSQLRLQRST